MPRGQKSPGSSSKAPRSAESPGTIAPRRKRPLLLAAAIVLLVAWLGFLVVLAMRG